MNIVPECEYAVLIPEPNPCAGNCYLGTKTITENGTYDALADDSIDGYSEVTVDVEPNLGTKTITANGTYLASSDDLDGFSEVTVDLPSANGVSF